jgi:transposase
MSKSVKKLKKTRRFSEDFKRTLVSEYERGESTVLELSRRYQVCFQTIYRWIRRYSIYQEKGYVIVEKHKSKEQELKAALARISELEQLVGQKQIKLEYLEKLIELADAEYGLDLKKKCFTRPLSGSDLTQK